MPKPPSSRTAVRNTPQPKVHSFVPAVFRDDYGRERALTADAAKSFSKKKLDAASRALERRANLAMERAIIESDRETARAIRKLRQQERQADIDLARIYSRWLSTKVRPVRKIEHKPPKPKSDIPPASKVALPKYDAPLRDRCGRLGVFFDSRYYSSKTAKPGVASRVVKYIFHGAHLDADGNVMWRTNVGETIDEAVCGFDHIELINRSSQKNAKVINHAVLAMDHRWTPEQMLDVGERWARERFGQHGLPFAISLHPPPPGGDDRNWHIHVVWSWRPLRRVGDHQWLVGEGLRSDLDGARGMWVLRERFAGISTLMSFERGERDVYTALSHAARGLPVEPQKKLGEAKTRWARAGEFVADNEENHERVLRSKAALIDDDLRREDDRLAVDLELARKVAAGIARLVKLPVPPAFTYAVSRFSVPSPTAAVDTWRAIALAEPGYQAPPSKGPSVNPVTIGKGIDAVRTIISDRKFANLRIGSVPAPPTARLYLTQPFAAQVPHAALPARANVPLAPIVPSKAFIAGKFAIPSPVIAPPAPAKQTVIPRPPARFEVFLAWSPPVGEKLPPTQAMQRTSARPPSLPPFEVKPFKAPPMSKIILGAAKAIGDIPKLPAMIVRYGNMMAGITIPPMAPVPLALRTRHIKTPLPATPYAPPSFVVPGADLSVTAAAADRAAAAELELTLARARALMSEDADSAAGVRQETNKESSARVSLKPSPSPWLLMAMLEERRWPIRKDKRGRWTLEAGLLREAGLTREQSDSEGMQRLLAKENAKQVEELREVASFIAEAPHDRLVLSENGWRLTTSAPERLRRIMHMWRADPRAQKAFGELASMPPVTKASTSVLEERQARLLNMIFDHNEVADTHDKKAEPSQRTTPTRLPWQFPDRGGPGMGG